MCCNCQCELSAPRQRNNKTNGPLSVPTTGTLDILIRVSYIFHFIAAPTSSHSLPSAGKPKNITLLIYVAARQEGGGGGGLFISNSTPTVPSHSKTPPTHTHFQKLSKLLFGKHTHVHVQRGHVEWRPLTFETDNLGDTDTLPLSVCVVTHTHTSAWQR